MESTIKLGSRPTLIRTLVTASSSGGSRGCGQKRPVSSSASKSQSSFWGANNRKYKMRENEETPLSGVSGTCLPLYVKSMSHANRTAVCDAKEDVHYGEAYKRSMRLAKSILDSLPRTHKSVPVAFIPNNTASDVVTLWAIWMSGNAAVTAPSDPATLEDALRDSRCQLLIADKSEIEKLNRAFASTHRPKLLLSDEVLEDASHDACEEQDELRDRHYFAENQSALLLYSKNSSSPNLFRHADLNAQADRVTSAWNMTNQSSVLHALPVAGNAYGLITSLLAPLAAGGRLVMLKQFDTIRVWCHLLGVAMNDAALPPPRVNLYPALPQHYAKLLERYQHLFTESKTKEFVKARSGQRIAAMFCSTSPADMGDVWKKWHEATGHNVVECLTDDRAGTVLCGDVDAAKDKKFRLHETHCLLPMPGVKARLVRQRQEGLVSSERQLQLRAEGSAVPVGEQWTPWVAVDGKAKLFKEGYEIRHEQAIN